MCAGYSEFRSQCFHLTKSWWMLFLTQCHTPQHRRSPPGKSPLAPVWQGQAVVPSPQGDGPVCQSVPGTQHEWSCCKTVHVLPGEKLPLLILHPKEPCRDPAASGARTQPCRREAAVSTEGEGRRILPSMGLTLKEHTELWQWIPVGHPAPCPAGPAPAAINVGP